MNKEKKAPNPIDLHVGARIRLRRNMVGMSQEKLGESLGITFQQVQKYEKGTNRVGASRLQHIADILQVPVGFFFENGSKFPSAGPSNPAVIELNTISAFIASKEGLELNQAFALIRDPAVRQNIVRLAKSVSKAAKEVD